MTDLCRTCGHHNHKHLGGSLCRAVTVSGPASDLGKPVGDGYKHTGRQVTTCTRPQLALTLEVAR